MSRYYATVNNTSTLPWVFGLYLTVSGSGLPTQSVGWLVLPVPPRTALPLTWDDGYDVCFGSRTSQAGQTFYETEDLQPSRSGWHWQLKTFQGEPLLEQVGDAPQPDIIRIDNLSGKAANLGLGMDGKAAVYLPDVLSDTAVQFKLPLAYRAALFVALVPGQVVQPLDVPVGPLDVNFPSGANAATFLISEGISGPSLSVTYASQVAAEQQQVEELRRRLGSG